MPTLQQQIVERFLARLAESQGLDRERLDKLRELMTSEKPPKADDFVSMFSMSAGGDIE